MTNSIKNFNLLEFYKTDNIKESFQHLHTYNNLLYDKHLNAYFFYKYSSVQEILSSHNFSTKPLMTRAQPVMGDRVLAQMESDEHHIKRKIILSNLTKQKFDDKYKECISNITNSLLNEHLYDNKIDLINNFGKKYSVLVTLSILGLPLKDYLKITGWHKEITHFITGFNLSAIEEAKSISSSKSLISYLLPIIKSKKESPNNDFISSLCTSELDGGTLTDSEVCALILNILLAATEPSDKTLGYFFYYLLENNLFDEIKNNRALIKNAITETLRLSSPVQLIPRQSEDNCSISGFFIPKGSLVFNMIGAANQDPLAFAQPEKFILNRKSTIDSGKRMNHLAFGYGTHTCVGAAFSQMQLELTINIMLDKIAGASLPNNFVLKEQGIYTRGPVAMPILCNVKE